MKYNTPFERKVTQSMCQNLLDDIQETVETYDEILEDKMNNPRFCDDRLRFYLEQLRTIQKSFIMMDVILKAMHEERYLATERVFQCSCPHGTDDPHRPENDTE